MNLKDLKKEYNLSDLELFTQDTSTHRISFAANKLKQTESTYTSGTAIRLIRNKRVGFCASYGNINQERMISQALDASNYSSEVSFELPEKTQKDETLDKEKVFSINEYIEKGNKLIEKILREAPNVLAEISFEVDNIKEKIENSKDLNYSHSKILHSFSINVKETLENNFFDIYTAVVDNKLPEYNIYTDELIHYYKLSQKQVKVKNGSYPVLFTSKAAKELLEVIELALNGKQINQKSSPWHNKLGKQVLSKLITIKQNPSFGYMSRAIDDEGVIIQPITFVNNGILENFYYDLSTGRDATNRISTGNGFKPSLTSQPEPSLLNMIISPGSRPMKQIIKDLNYGLLIDQTMGGLTVNMSGDISVNVDIGFLIEKGELVGRVKDTMVTGNIYSGLNNILEISNDLKQHWSNIYNPDMLIGGFMITS